MWTSRRSFRIEWCPVRLSEELQMHTALVHQIALDRQVEIARATARRRRFLSGRSPKATWPASRGGGMLQLWRPGSAAHGS